MKIKTQDLTGAQLDWMVAKCAGYVEQGVYGTPEFRDSDVYLCYCGAVLNSCYSPSTDWAQGGPILERENISVGYQGHLGVPLDSLWYATNRVDACGFGQKPLPAALRCYVASKLGDTIEVPDELL